MSKEIELDQDDVSVALREAVRTGRIIVEKDDEGRDVFRVAPLN